MGPIVLELAGVYPTDRELAPLFALARGRPRTNDYAAFALANRGDPVRGRALFDDQRGVGCIKCHRVNGAGGEGGPDLSRVAVNYGRADLIDSVLFPSKKVADGFRTTMLRFGTVKSFRVWPSRTGAAARAHRRPGAET